MQHVVLDGIDPADIEDAFDPGTYAKGVRYAQQRAVQHMEWSDEANGLCAVVAGSQGRTYWTTVYFASGGGARLDFVSGECSCPVGFDCKHVVAVVLTAAAPRLVGTAALVAGAAPRPVAPWEQTLRSLVDAPAPTGAQRAGGVALAIELSLAGGPASHGAASSGPKLAARLVREGKTGWVGGGLSWNRLEVSYQLTDCDPRHLRPLRELYALYRTGPRSSSPYYSYGSYGEEKSIDLAAFPSRQLWALLDEAREAGVRLVYPRKQLGTLERIGHAEPHLDVTAGKDPGGLAITPVLRVEGVSEAVAVRFVGEEGHGVVYLPPAEDHGGDPANWRFGLARLAAPVPKPLQQLLLDGQRLELPADAAAQFSERFYPRLRGLARVVSSDGSFTPPVISDPILVLRASYGPGHNLTLDWEWAYQVGATAMRAPLRGPAAEHPYRDPAKEQAVLEALDVPLERFGLGGDAVGRSPAPRAELRGLDTMRFTTELLPLLNGTDGVTVEVEGDPPDYREAGDSLRIGVSAEEVAGQTDWFDLGVRITVEGREVPFAEVFVALAAGEAELLLPDGAYFSLQKPELRALRGLIEEARALQEPGQPGLRISRF
ncbi:MAG TPA: SWIM zinc finger family protein, partial [Pseudonocardiaceae bacterium]|nr:SWIM zinc finger family protein [Pseudonocardiaceae bacterium]